jgi:deoxyadenosine/deoxycytidine kinase
MIKFRTKKYKNYLKNKKVTIQDRTIFEDRIFASLSISDEKA